MDRERLILFYEEAQSRLQKSRSEEENHHSMMRDFEGRRIWMDTLELRKDLGIHCLQQTEEKHRTNITSEENEAWILVEEESGGSRKAFEDHLKRMYLERLALEDAESDARSQHKARLNHLIQIRRRFIRQTERIPFTSVRTVLDTVQHVWGKHDYDDVSYVTHCILWFLQSETRVNDLTLMDLLFEFIQWVFYTLRRTNDQITDICLVCLRAFVQNVGSIAGGKVLASPVVYEVLRSLDDTITNLLISIPETRTRDDEILLSTLITLGDMCLPGHPMLSRRIGDSDQLIRATKFMLHTLETWNPVFWKLFCALCGILENVSATCGRLKQPEWFLDYLPCVVNTAMLLHEDFCFLSLHEWSLKDSEKKEGNTVVKCSTAHAMQSIMILKHILGCMTHLVATDSRVREMFTFITYPISFILHCLALSQSCHSTSTLYASLLDPSVHFINILCRNPQDKFLIQILRSCEIHTYFEHLLSVMCTKPEASDDIALLGLPVWIPAKNISSKCKVQEGSEESASLHFQERRRAKLRVSITKVLKNKFGASNSVLRCDALFPIDTLRHITTHVDNQQVNDAKNQFFSLLGSYTPYSFISWANPEDFAKNRCAHSIIPNILFQQLLHSLSCTSHEGISLSTETLSQTRCGITVRLGYHISDPSRCVGIAQIDVDALKRSILSAYDDISNIPPTLVSDLLRTFVKWQTRIAHPCISRVLAWSQSRNCVFILHTTPLRQSTCDEFPMLLGDYFARVHENSGLRTQIYMSMIWWSIIDAVAHIHQFQRTHGALSIETIFISGTNFEESNPICLMGAKYASMDSEGYTNDILSIFDILHRTVSHKTDIQQHEQQIISKQPNLEIHSLQFLYSSLEEVLRTIHPHIFEAHQNQHRSTKFIVESHHQHVLNNATTQTKNGNNLLLTLNALIQNWIERYK